MGLLTPGWLKKALHLRTIVSCAPIKDLTDDEIEMYDRMHDFNRGTISADEFRRHSESWTARQRAPLDLLHEPAEIYGWSLRAALYGRKGSPWWLVGVHRTKGRTFSAKDVAVLARVMNVLGCDDMKRDQLSVSEFAFLIENDCPVLYTWPNTGELLEVQVHKEQIHKSAKRGMRIVPRGSRATDGFTKLEELAAEVREGNDPELDSRK